MPYFEPMRFAGERKAQDCKRVVLFQNLRRCLYAVGKKPRVRKGLYGYIEYRLRAQDANRCGECGIRCCGSGKKTPALQAFSLRAGFRFNHIFQYLNLARTAAIAVEIPNKQFFGADRFGSRIIPRILHLSVNFIVRIFQRCSYYTLSLCFRLRGVCVSPKREKNKSAGKAAYDLKM